MNSLEATARVIDVLETLEIDYILVGAMSSNAYGVARSTKDADVVANYESAQLRQLATALGSEYQLDPQVRFETLTNTLRNVITYVPTKFDIELFRIGTDPHHQERFRRRVQRMLGELQRTVWMPTPEDVIIQKLRWARRKDLDDALNVLSVQFADLDWDYMRRWTDRHDTTALLDQLRDELSEYGLPESD